MEVWQNLIIQLGISGLVVGAGFKIAIILIEKWATGDTARTKTIGDGFQSIAAIHEKVIETMNDHQQNEIGILNQHAQQLTALNAKIDTALDLTPVRGIPRTSTAKVIVSRDAEDTPVENPRVMPRAASSPGAYGPKKP